ncbi:hypothetical protein HNR07_001237 [Nocardiopsis metallicus]|uniref:Uncharacterized protein n=1 Tax=Nocardiopsis metallicus TaxID=179819 RepID=A0A840VZZ7_9ACTN|nr:hypothetical protein [Nocardiopsis metallicus]
MAAFAAIFEGQHAWSGVAYPYTRLRPAPLGR